MTNEHPTEYAPTAGAISIIERLTQLPTVLLTTSFLLALDFAVSVGYKMTLLQLTFGLIAQKMTVGSLLLFCVCFGLFMSIGIALIKHIMDGLAYNILLPIWQRAFPHNDEARTPYRGAIHPYKLLEAAQLEQNKFYLDIYNKHNDEKINERNEMQHISSSSLSCLFLLVVNCLVLPHQNYPSLCSQLAEIYPESWIWLLPTFVVILLFSWLFPLLHHNSSQDWVFCLPLYEK